MKKWSVGLMMVMTSLITLAQEKNKKEFNTQPAKAAKMIEHRWRAVIFEVVDARMKKQHHHGRQASHDLHPGKFLNGRHRAQNKAPNLK